MARRRGRRRTEASRGAAIRWWLTALPAVGLAALVACANTYGLSSERPTAQPPAPTPSGGSPSRPVELTIFAAASLRDAFEQLEGVFARSHPEVTLTYSFDASSALRAQIEHGAPADIFASADRTNAGRLADAGLTAGPPVHFVRNALAVIVPADNRAGVATLADLARPGLRIIAAGEEVPISTYAEELLTNLARGPGFPADFVIRVTANIASREDNVTAIVAKIELGEGDAAIVYRTDALAARNVRVLEVPPAASIEAIYAAVAVGGSAHPEMAREFVGWLTSPDAQAVLAAFGFLPPA